MSDRIVLRLDDKFALGADDLQWMLLKLHPRRNKADSWDGISFVRSTKAIWTVEAQRALDGYPDTFDAWKAAVPAPALETVAA